MTRIGQRGGWLVMVVAMAACNGDRGEPPGPSPPTGPSTGVSLSPTTLQFPATGIGDASFAHVTVANGGSSPERMTSFEPASTEPLWPTQAGTCNTQFGFVLPPASSCTFQFGFRPPAIGPHSANGAIRFQSGARLEVALTGAGVALPGLRVIPTSLQFPVTIIGQASFALVTITNGRSSAARMTGFEPVDSDTLWPTQGGTCNVTYGFVVPPAASCTFQFGFRPPNVGNHTATGAILFEGGTRLEVALSGVGTF